MTVVNRKSHQRGIRFLHHIDGWLWDRARKNPRNVDDSMATEVKAIIDEKYETETGNDSLTGKPKNVVAPCV